MRLHPLAIKLHLPALLGVLLLTALLLPEQAQAQEPALPVQVEQFEPLPAQGINILSTATSDLLPHLSPSAGLFLHFVDDPLQVVERDGDRDEPVSRLLDDQLKGELLLAVGLFEVVDLGLALPLVFYQSGSSLTAAGLADDFSGFSVADLRIIPKVRVVHPDWAAGFGAALALPLYLPIGDVESYNSDGMVRAEPRLVVDYRYPEVGLTVAGNIGILFRPQTRTQNFTIDDTIRWALASTLPTGVDGFSVLVNLFGSFQTADQIDTTGAEINPDDLRTSPVEAQAGLQFLLPYDLVANVGAGGGLTRGVGAPDFRVFGSISYTPLESGPIDTDGDGIFDDVDRCPRRPEDVDGFEDGDGCPELDNDEDGIPDVDDKCPMRPEDIDTFEDEDGCPDPDNDSDTVLDVDDDCPLEPGVPEKNGCPLRDKDGDGIPDDRDQCPEDPEDKDGFEDADGCPDPDNDADGILDEPDRCPNQPEDVDQFQDEDGCPDPDNDGDGIPDDRDKCPNDPETINGVDDTDGCPDKGKSKVRVTRTKIEILDKVYFETNKDVIQQRSYNLLNQVAAVLKANPQITKLRVEGHTDERGKDDYNLDLSQRRALAVRNYLSAQGIDEARLTYKGYGETLPIEDCSDKRGRRKRSCWAKNRRVEFTILEVEGQPVGPDGAIIEKKEQIEP